jgi:hypothetical protein
MATLRTAALNLLRLASFQLIRCDLQAVMHNITALLAMARRQPKTNPCRNFESALAPPRLETGSCEVPATTGVGHWDKRLSAIPQNPTFILFLYEVISPLKWPLLAFQ